MNTVEEKVKFCIINGINISIKLCKGIHYSVIPKSNGLAPWLSLVHPKIFFFLSFCHLMEFEFLVCVSCSCGLEDTWYSVISFMWHCLTLLDRDKHFTGLSWMMTLVFCTTCIRIVFISFLHLIFALTVLLKWSESTLKWVVFLELLYSTI